MLAFLAVLAANARAQEPRAVARLVAASGAVEVVRAGRAAPARALQVLEPGDVVRTSPDGRAALLLADESQIRMHVKSVLEIRDVGPPPVGVVPVAARAGQTLPGVNQGEAGMRTRAPAARIQTPSVSASIRGTGLAIRVEADGTSRVAVLDGRVDVANPAGQMLLRAGEAATARVGAPPTRTVPVRPVDAVQWAFAYPGVTSPRGYPLSAERAASLARALQTHLAGELAPAHAAGFPLEQALEPVSRIWQYHAAWDGEITPRTFLHAPLFRTDRTPPDLPPAGTARSALVETRRPGGTIARNQLLTDEVGLAADYLHARRQDSTERGDDDQVRIRLSYVHRIGLSAASSLPASARTSARPRRPGRRRAYGCSAPP